MIGYELLMLGLIRGCFTTRAKALDWRSIYIQKNKKAKKLEYEIREIELDKNGTHPKGVTINPTFDYV